MLEPFPNTACSTIVFRVDLGTVYLAGYSVEKRLKMTAEMAAKRASGVDDRGTRLVHRVLAA